MSKFIKFIKPAHSNYPTNYTYASIGGKQITRCNSCNKFICDNGIYKKIKGQWVLANKNWPPCDDIGQKCPHCFEYMFKFADITAWQKRIGLID